MAGVEGMHDVQLLLTLRSRALGLLQLQLVALLHERDVEVERGTEVGRHLEILFFSCFSPIVATTVRTPRTTRGGLRVGLPKCSSPWPGVGFPWSCP